MKRWGIAVAVVLLVIFCVLNCTAIDPEDFTGDWYSSREQCIYHFQNGLIYCQKYPIFMSDGESVSGAYVFSGKSIFLFAEGIEGLEAEREVYLVETADESLLCEREDGTGKIYFIRANRKK
jgi:hypothetical protein